MRLAIKTFGCKANTSDSDILALEAIKRGHIIVDSNAKPDAFVINSCTVTEHADRDARTEATRFKRSNPFSMVAVIGCYGQVAKDELLGLPQIDLVMGTAQKLSVLEHLETALNSADSARDRVEAATGFLPENFPGSRHARAILKIQDGCNFSCTFCIIPRARGRSRSLTDETVLGQVRAAVAQGFREVVVTGIHLAHFGWDQGSELSTIVRRILDVDGVRMRLSTLDPFEIPDSILKHLNHPRFCPHFHIALQSGSDRILREMRRIYQAREFVDATEKIYSRNPNTFIGVDVIVGFPGETEKEFEETVHCLENSYWTKLHVFPYSPRSGTPAAILPGAVSSTLMKERTDRLLKLSEKRYREFLDSQVGRSVEVLVEKNVKNSKTVWQGHSENYLPVVCEFDGAKEKEIRTVILKKRDQDRMLGVAV